MEPATKGHLAHGPWLQAADLAEVAIVLRSRSIRGGRTLRVMATQPFVDHHSQGRVVLHQVRCGYSMGGLGGAASPRLSALLEKTHSNKRTEHTPLDIAYNTRRHYERSVCAQGLTHTHVYRTGCALWRPSLYY